MVQHKVKVQKEKHAKKKKNWQVWKTGLLMTGKISLQNKGTCSHEYLPASVKHSVQSHVLAKEHTRQDFDCNSAEQCLGKLLRWFLVQRHQKLHMLILNFTWTTWQTLKSFQSLCLSIVGHLSCDSLNCHLSFLVHLCVTSLTFSATKPTHTFSNVPTQLTFRFNLRFLPVSNF